MGYELLYRDSESWVIHKCEQQQFADVYTVCDRVVYWQCGQSDKLYGMRQWNNDQCGGSNQL